MIFPDIASSYFGPQIVILLIVKRETQVYLMTSISLLNMCFNVAI